MNGRVAVGVVTIVAGLASIPADAVAQSAGPQPGGPGSGLGYVFGGVGAASGAGYSDATMHVGGGFEVLSTHALGIGAEIGYLTPFDSFSAGIGILSVNGAYHFGEASRKTRPFITGGYTLAFREGHENMFNVGAGLDYWLKRKVGLRVEFRDHIWTGDGTTHFWGAPCGVVLR